MSPSSPRPPRLPRWLRSSEDLPLARSRTRISSYLYGNILVLGAVVASSPASILQGTAVIIVAATTLTTFLAHMVAHGVAQQLGRTEADAQAHLRQELRDAVPILTSGTIPVIMLALGALTVLTPQWAEIIASGVLVARIAFTGILVERMSGKRPSLGVAWTGLTLAAVSLVLVAVKVLLTH